MVGQREKSHGTAERALTIDRPQVAVPDAGVIEEARARSRRRRGTAVALTLSAAVIAVILLGFGGGGAARPGSTSMPSGRAPSQTARLSPTTCPSVSKALHGAPSRSLLSILGVLRRPATAADAVPRSFVLQGVGGDAFVHYIRRTRVVRGSPYYIYPAILGGCGGQAHQGMMNLATNIDLGAGTMGGTGGGGATAAEIGQGRAAETGPPGSSTSATITMIVPDGVANVTLRYPAGRASGYSPKISPPVTLKAPVVNNEVVVRVPRSSGGSTIQAVTMTWRAADGHVIKTFNTL